MFSLARLKCFATFQSAAARCLPRVLHRLVHQPAVSALYKETVSRLEPYRAELLVHPLYETIQTRRQLQQFMGVHVWAVWDFMSLVMVLKDRLAPVRVPWLPPRDRESARFINEIVLGEESDIVGVHKHQSHFELYVDAMKEIGAANHSVQRVLRFFEHRQDGDDVILRPTCAAEFVKVTFSYCREDTPTHHVASAFLFGREDVIPQMFQRLLKSLATQANPDSLRAFRYYLERHIQVDGEEHGPMAQRLLENVCGEDTQKWHEVEEVAKDCIRARINLWDGTLAMIART